MERAYSILEVKELTEDNEFLRIAGIATTPTTDRIGDIVEPLGARFKTPMPLLWHHKHDQPVGLVTFAKATRDGIPFRAQLPFVREAGKVKERVDEAIHSIRYQLVMAVSIGFKAVKDQVEQLKTGGLRFKEWDWIELSLVTIPANTEAVLDVIKALDGQHLPALGREGANVESLPGASGTTATKRGPYTLIPRNRK